MSSDREDIIQNLKWLSAIQTRRRLLKLSTGLAASAIAMPLIGRGSTAQAAYPDRPIKLIVPFGPGGPVDVVARVMAPPLSDLLGASVIVENRPGASGNIGTGIAARSDPDGYTIVVQASSFVINPLLFTTVPYKVEGDFAPLVDIADTPTAFAVHPRLGVKTLSEFAALARQKGGFSYSHPGFGTVSQLTAELFKIRTGIDLAAVAHNGGGPATQSLLSGSVELCSAALPALHGLIESGSVVGLGVTSPKRWYDLPNLPTFIESGYAEFSLANFTALLVPLNTPKEIVDRLSAAAIAILQPPEFRAKLRAVGLETTAGSPAALKERIARETKIWREVARVAGIKPVEAK